MKVILLKTVPKLGHGGEIKEVNSGYARNFLIPQNLAEIASKHSLNMLREQAEKKKRRAVFDIKEREKLARSMDKKKINIELKADDKGTLYAALTASVLAKKLKEQGFEISPRELKLKKNIKKIGKHYVDLNLGGFKSKIQIIINADK